MKLNKWILTGTSLAVAGMLLLGAAYVGRSESVAFAGNCAPTATPDPLSQGQTQPDLIAAVQQQCTPVSTPTTRIVRTHTATPTSTEAPKTSTPVPPTQAPPPPPTVPSSGNEGVNVRPPNTGTGDSGSGTDYGVWMLVLGTIAIAAGGGAVLAGVRKR